MKTSLRLALAALITTLALAGCWENSAFLEDPQIAWQAKSKEERDLRVKLGETPPAAPAHHGEAAHGEAPAPAHGEAPAPAHGEAPAPAPAH